MILYSAPASPFGRMVKLTASCLGQIDDIEVRATNTGDPDDGIRQINPLGKIPALVVAGQGDEESGRLDQGDSNDEGHQCGNKC